MFAAEHEGTWTAQAAGPDSRPLSVRDATCALLPDDEIVVDGVQARFVEWQQAEHRRWMLLRTRVREPRLAGKEAAIGSDRTLLYRVEAEDGLQLALASAYLPTFSELTRCTWGTHVTVRGQPAQFNQAGVIEGREVVVVLAGHNTVLGAESWYCEAADGGEYAYYFDYEQAGLRVGTPPAAPLLREQATAWLRSGDTVLVNGCAAAFLELKSRSDGLWLALKTLPGSVDGLQKIGAEPVDDRRLGRVWRLRWDTCLVVRLVSERLPTFMELSRLKPGTPVTVGPGAIQAQLQATWVRDGTKQFVMVTAAARLSLHQADSQPIPDSPAWMYRIRFEAGGLRLTDASAD